MTRKRHSVFVVLTIALLCGAPWAYSQSRAKGKIPPANVVVSKLTKGVISPAGEFIGTVYYPEVSEVPAEVSGTVKSMDIEEGRRVSKGKILVVLDSELLEKDLQSRKSSYEQVLFDLEKANRDMKRLKHLYKKKIASEKDFDDQHFQIKSIEKKAAALKSSLEQLEIEIRKTVIRAPFTGIILKRHVSRGEWLSPGKTVATIARDDVMDVIVEVPESVAVFVKPDTAVQIKINNSSIPGSVFAVIPRGDVATRTFPVKIRISKNASLFEGMAAGVRLPLGEKIEVFMAPRDAVLNRSGKSEIVAVEKGKAALIPVTVAGYQGMKIGIRSKSISAGMKVVVKGNERLRKGQPVNIIKEIE